jgi:hypothetical protein
MNTAMAPPRDRRVVDQHMWDGHRRLGLLVVAAAIILTVVIPPVGAVVDLAVAAWGHYAGNRAVRNWFLLLAILDVVWIVLGIGHGSHGIYPA